MADSTRYPTYPLLSNILTSMRTTFDNYQPEMPAGREKLIHSVGSVCKVEWTIPSDRGYTGILESGTHKGFIRMGGAVDPKEGLTPGLGLKFPRSGRHDADFVMLYSLVEQSSWNFFGLNQSNHIAPAVDFATKVLAAKFKDASQCPYQVGLSDLATWNEDGAESKPKFPFKIFFEVNPRLETGRRAQTIDGVHAEIDSLSKGTVLYTAWACTEPKGDETAPSETLEASCGKPVRLGPVSLASGCSTSYYGDSALHFRHQRIEDDWRLQPSLMKWGKYDANVACAATVRSDGAPPICGLEQEMLATDA